MRRLVALGIALFVVSAPSALAAGEDTATIRGRVLLGDTGKPAPGAEVTLLGARVDGGGGVVDKTSRTDSEGRYSFRVPAQKGIEFALEASFDGGLFVGDSFRVDNEVISSNLRVWETTSDPNVITVLRDHIFVAQDEQGAGVLESVTLENTSGRAYIGRGQALGAADSESSPTLGFALPTRSLGQRVDLVNSSLNRLYAVEAGFGFAATVAIPPGETSVTFAYPALGPGGRGTYDLTRRALYPTEDLSIFLTEPLQVQSGRLVYDGIEQVSDDRYRTWSSRGPFDAGDVVPLLVIAEGSSSSALYWAVGISFGAILLLILAGLWIRSRSSRRTPRKRAPTSGTPKPRAREEDDLIASIAALDLQHENGNISRQQWSERRAELKSKLLETQRTTS